MVSPDFQKSWAETAKRVETHLRQVVPSLAPGSQPGLKALRESMEYSTYEGGKRFRPVMCLWTYEMLKGEFTRAMPLAAALEMVHCYSLIHDDLPCMDDDDLRRGRPTNHKVYGEAMALLAGNTLITEVFGVLARAYHDSPEVVVELVEQFVQAAGGRGMIGGQALDISAEAQAELSLPDVEFLHALKTGALIRLSATSAATLAGATEAQRRALRTYGEQVGLAFQIADDLLDHDPKNPEVGSYPALVGVTETKRLLDQATEAAMGALVQFGDSARKLKEMCLYNRERTN